jgi:hypothetical protein
VFKQNSYESLFVARRRAGGDRYRDDLATGGETGAESYHTVFVESRAACKWVGGAVVVDRLVGPVRKESVSTSGVTQAR